MCLDLKLAVTLSKYHLGSHTEGKWESWTSSSVATEEMATEDEGKQYAPVIVN